MKQKPEQAISAILKNFKKFLLFVWDNLQKFAKFLWKHLKRFGRFLNRSWKKFLRGFTKWIDPKLEPYRTHPRANLTTPERVKTSTEVSLHNSTSKSGAVSPSRGLKTWPEPTTINPPTKPPTLSDTPLTRDDLLATLRDAPMTVFTPTERTLMESILSLDTLKATNLMLPADKIVYVDAGEVLGPLTLDRLYQTGLAHFPVTDSKKQIIGCIHTERLNSLDIKETSTAGAILDPDVYYIREDYTLRDVLDTFLRTHAYFFLVVSRYGRTVGMLTFDEFCDQIFGEPSDSDFLRDSDRLAVAKRTFPIVVPDQTS